MRRRSSSTTSSAAPPGSVVRVFAGGILQASAPASVADGSVSVAFFLSRTSEIALSVDDHPATVCGIDVARQSTVAGGTGAATGLPRTGRSHTWAGLILGLALVVVGGGLVLAIRREDDIGDDS